MASLIEQRERIVTTLYAAVLSDVMDMLGLMNQALRPFVRPRPGADRALHAALPGGGGRGAI
jgi:hypothetical protein